MDNQITVGADPEVFLFDNEEESVVPCVGKLSGTKDQPFSRKDWAEGFAVQEDNVMAEFNIPPASTAKQFKTNIMNGLGYLAQELMIRHGDRYNLYYKDSTNKFLPKHLMSPQAKTIGCEPDFSAYDGGKVRINPPKPTLERHCGGHVHIGGDFKCPHFVAALFAELFMVCAGAMKITKGDSRAKWYGRPGIYRPKPYGIEYRTPNNSWLSRSSYITAMGDAALRCSDYLTNTDAAKLHQQFRSIEWTQLQKIVSCGSSRNMGISKIKAQARSAGVPV